MRMMFSSSVHQTGMAKLNQANMRTHARNVTKLFKITFDPIRFWLLHREIWIVFPIPTSGTPSRASVYRGTYRE